MVGVGPTDDPTCFNQSQYQQYYLGAITLANTNNPAPGPDIGIPIHYTIYGENYADYYIPNIGYMTWVSSHTITVMYAHRNLVACPTCCYGCPIGDVRNL